VRQTNRPRFRTANDRRKKKKEGRGKYESRPGRGPAKKRDPRDHHIEGDKGPGLTYKRKTRREKFPAMRPKKIGVRRKANKRCRAGGTPLAG